MPVLGSMAVRTDPANVHRRKLSVIAKIVPVAVAINGANSLFIAWLFWNDARDEMLSAWCVVSLLYSMSMLLDPMLLRRTERTGKPWLYRAIMSRAPLLGCIWGSVPWIVLPAHRVGEGLLIGIIVNGMIAGGMMRLSIFPRAALSFGCITALLTTAAAFGVNPITGLGVLILETSFLLFMGRHIVAHVGTIVESWSGTDQAVAIATAEQRLFDTLTGLPNRAACRERLNEALASGSPLSVLVIDIDRFRELNAAYGHAVGDYYLQALGRRLASALPFDHTLCRTDGDNFVVLAPGSDTSRLLGLASQLVEAAADQLHAGTLVLSSRIRIGLALARTDPSADLVQEAELALVEAKVHPHDRIAIFQPDMRRRADDRHVLLLQLARAAVAGEFRLVYQPQVEFASGRLVGCEALLRWEHPTRGLLGPGAFIETLAENDLSAEVGWWVLGEACRQLAIWRAAGTSVPKVGVNLFAAQFRSPDLEARVRDALARHDLPPDALELEVTENIALNQPDGPVDVLRRLRRLGVGMAFDDFGTGYASLSSIKRFPLTRLKIDRSFVRDLGSSQFDRAVVSAVLAMAATLQLDVVAEGVETPAQADQLAGLGCGIAQGFLFDPGLPPDLFAVRYGAGRPCSGRVAMATI